MNEELKKIFDDFKKELDKSVQEQKEDFKQLHEAIRKCNETIDYYMKLLGWSK